LNALDQRFCDDLAAIARERGISELATLIVEVAGDVGVKAALHEAIVRAYLGHPRLRLIDSSEMITAPIRLVGERQR
jgi:hypothetical protein